MFTTEVWLTPLILLPGVALLTVSTAHRFGQVQVEFHRLLDHPDSPDQIVARSLVIRAGLYRDALASLYASVGLFALGSLLGGVINLWRPEALWVVGGITITGIAAIVFSAVQRLRESLLSLQIVREQSAAIVEFSRALALAWAARKRAFSDHPEPGSRFRPWNLPWDKNLVTECGQLFQAKFYLPG